MLRLVTNLIDSPNCEEVKLNENGAPAREHALRKLEELVLEHQFGGPKLLAN
jgi:hypothetical protein